MADTKTKKAVAKAAKALETLKVVYIPITAITPNDYNPNRQSEHEFELLQRSMREDGFTQPVVCVPDPKDPIITEPDGAGLRYKSGKVVIVDGEHRWRSAAALGYTEIPVVVAPMSLAQARIATLRHNRARGTEDIDLTTSLMRDLRELGALDWAQDSLMLDDLEMKRLLDDLAAPEALAAADFSESWEPNKHEREDEQHTVGDRGIVSMTPEAIAADRLKAKLDAEGVSVKDRVARKAELDTFRVVAIFGGPDAVLVKSILGDRAAERIVELCKAAQA